MMAPTLKEEVLAPISETEVLAPTLGPHHVGANIENGGASSDIGSLFMLAPVLKIHILTTELDMK